MSTLTPSSSLAPLSSPVSSGYISPSSAFFFSGRLSSSVLIPFLVDVTTLAAILLCVKNTEFRPAYQPSLCTG